MTYSSPQRIASLLARRDEVSAMLSTGNLAADMFVAISKAYAELEPAIRHAWSPSSG
jgi:peptide chain release factor 1